MTVEGFNSRIKDIFS